MIKDIIMYLKMHRLKYKHRKQQREEVAMKRKIQEALYLIKIIDEELKKSQNDTFMDRRQP